MDLSDLLRFHQVEAKDLLLDMLALNPNHRISASNALNHAYFSSGVSVVDTKDLPPPGVKVDTTNASPKAKRAKN